MFLDRIFMQGCYIDGGSTSAGGGIADPQAEEDVVPFEEPQEGELGEDSGNPDQKRTSKQAPEIDSAFAEARRAREAADKANREAAELRRQLELTRLEAQSKQAESAEEKFNVELQREVSRLREAGWDETSISIRVDSMQAKYESKKLREDMQRSEAQRKKELEESKLQQNIDFTKRAIMEDFRELRKEYPDLLPAGVRTFDELMEKLDQKVADKMFNDNISFENAFKIVNLKKIAKREAERGEDKDRDNADRSTSSGKERLEAGGGNYGLTDRQQQLAKDGGMTNKQYAALLKHVKK